MLQGTADDAWHRSNRFQHNRTMTIPTGEKRVGEEPQKQNERISNPVGKTPVFVVSIKLGLSGIAVSGTIPVLRILIPRHCADCSCDV